MVRRKNMLIRKRDAALSIQHRLDDITSCEIFLKKFQQGETSIRSPFFTGSDRERKLLKRLCRYYGLTLVEVITYPNNKNYEYEYKITY